MNVPRGSDSLRAQVTVVNFRGRAIPVASVNPFPPDGNLACETLAHLNPPQLPTLILAELARDVTDLDNPALKGSAGGDYRNLCALIEATKPKAALPLLFSLATAKPRRTFVGGVGATAYYSSDRTNVLCTFIALNDQKPEDYGFRRQHAAWPGPWTIATAQAEAAAVQQITKSWNAAQHADTVNP